MTYPETPSALADTAEHNPDIARAVNQITLFHDQYEYAREYDDINLWEAFMVSPAGETLRQADIQFDPNFCGVVIDSVANRLEITSVTATTADGATADGAESEVATALVNDVWDTNELGNYLRVWHRKACRDGDAYVMVWPSEFETVAGMEIEAQDPGSEMLEVADSAERPRMVNITYCDPRVSRMFYDDENPRVKRVFAQKWIVAAPGADGRDEARTRLNLLYPDRIEKYITKPGCKGDKPTDFESYVEQVDMIEYQAQLAAVTDDGTLDEPVYPWPMPNPYGQIPVFHLRTDLDYGRPVHRNAFALQDALSKLIEYLMVTVQFQGFPQAYALQEADSVKSQMLQSDPLSDSAPFADSGLGGGGISLTEIPEGAPLDSGITNSGITLSPGTIALLKGFKEIGQFTPADPNAFLEPWREFAKAISATTDTPLWKFSGLGGQLPSGESLKVAEAPLNKKVIDISRLFGTTERRMFEFILEILGYPDAKVTITWANPATTDLLEVWALVELKVKLGVPRWVAFMQAGVPEAQAREWAEAYDQAQADAVKNAAATDPLN